MIDQDSKYYKEVFQDKNLSFEDKLNICSEYAILKIKNNISLNNLFYLVRETGIIPIYK